jgi:hypothetical protein
MRPLITLLLLFVGSVSACTSDPSGDGSAGPATSTSPNAPGDAGGPSTPTGPGEPAKPPVCRADEPGDYCGGDHVDDGDPSTLYTCAGAGAPPVSATKCAAGCEVAPPGTPDTCKTVASPNSYRLPWPAAQSGVELTQDCNDSCCSDHVGVDAYAWDFGVGAAFPVVAARGGTITHLKIDSTNGCGSPSCMNDANYIVIDHGDATQSTYLHLQGFSLAKGVACGATVTQGQALATTGSTGWSTGVHLHFQVSSTIPGGGKCECGIDGTDCSATDVPWWRFWPTASHPTLKVSFEEWPDSAQCNDRRITMPRSKN